MQIRSILHCDLNNFYASVECLLRPDLKGKPVAVCGAPEERHGIILSKSQEAKAYGVRTAETIWEAKAKCPGLICVQPHYELYAKYSNEAKAIYNNYTDYIEPFGIDECWLDVTGSKILGTGLEIAHKIREEVKQKTGGLTISVGVSFNKPFAKLGSDLKKPDAVTEISQENFKTLIWPLPAQELFMIGRKTGEALKKLNIFTIGQLASAGCNLMKEKFGVNGLKMIESAKGLDSSPVARITEAKIAKSVGHGTTTSKDLETYDEAERVIFMLSDMVGARLRRYGLAGKTACLDLRYNDLTHISRQLTLPSYVFTAKALADGAVSLLHENWQPGVDLPLRTITVSIANLCPLSDNLQQNLFKPFSEKDEKAESAIDKIRGKHGFDAITRGNTLNIPFAEHRGNDEDDLLPFKR